MYEKIVYKFNLKVCIFSLFLCKWLYVNLVLGKFGMGKLYMILGLLVILFISFKIFNFLV